MDQGADFSTTFSIETANGGVLDLSTYTGASQMRKNYTSSNDTPFTITLSNTGIIDISLTSNVTSSLIPGRYLYDIEIISSTNVVSRVIEGIVDVSPDITR